MNPSEPLVTPEELQCLLAWPESTSPIDVVLEPWHASGEGTALLLAQPWLMAQRLPI